MSQHEISQVAGQTLNVHPVAGRIGAEIRGIRLEADLDAGVLKQLRSALLKYKVIFIKGQQHLDDAGQEAFAQRLGRPVAHPTVPIKPGTSYVLELNSDHGGRADSWHTDVTFVDATRKSPCCVLLSFPKRAAIQCGPIPLPPMSSFLKS